MMALLDSINEWISPDANLEAFFNCIWDIERQGGAFGAGLDIWGRIVNVKRVLELTTEVDHFNVFFGFAEAGAPGFGQAPFYNGGPITTTSSTTANFTLSDEAYRLLIFAKAAYNITNGSIGAINAILMNLFPGRGNAYVIDGGQINREVPFGFGEGGDYQPFGFGTFMDSVDNVNNMTMVYVFDFVLQPFEIAIIVSSGALPKPTGVKATARYPGS